VSLLVPYDRGDVVARVHRHGQVDAVEHLDDGSRLTVRLPTWLAGELAAFAVA
jgi:GTP-binding protein HflX